MGERRGTKGLELWCRRMTEGYPGVKIDNMTTSWRDGLAFCAIIHHFRPDLIEFSKLNKDDVYHNNELAFRIAEQYLGIPALLEPEDMVEYAVPDRLSILTYLSQFYQAFAVTQGKSTARIAPKRAQTSPDHGIVSPTSTSPPTKVAVVAATASAAGKIRREPCAKCALPVFIAERLNVGKLLYHRTCFRCARCSSQLTLANYYETENGEFCCEICPDEERQIGKKQSPERSVLFRSMSDEEKSANLQKMDGYSAHFECALEFTKDAELQKNSTLNVQQSDEIQKARSEFFKAQIDGASSSGSDSGNEEDVPPDLPNSGPPKLEDITEKITLVTSDSGFPKDKQNTSVNNSVSESSDNQFVTKDSPGSIVKARMKLFETEEIVPLEKKTPQAAVISLDDLEDFDNINRKEVDTVPSDIKDEDVIVINDSSSSISTEEPVIVIEDSPVLEQNKKPSEETPSSVITVSTEDNSYTTADSSRNFESSIENSDAMKYAYKTACDIQIQSPNEDSMIKDEIEDIKEEEVSRLEVTESPVEKIQDTSKVNEEIPIPALVEEETEYPDELNPFGDDPEDEPSKDTKQTSLNPFGDDTDEEDVGSEIPVASPRIKRKILPNLEDREIKGTPEHLSKIYVERISVNPFEDSEDDNENVESKTPDQKKKILSAPKISLNPFWSDDEENEDRKGNKRPIPAPRTSRSSNVPPEPKPRETSSLAVNSFGSNSSISSGSVVGSARKKKPAPRPPMPFAKWENDGQGSANSSPIHSVSHSPHLTPKHRKSKRAPPPPPSQSSTPAPGADKLENRLSSTALSPISLDYTQSTLKEENRLETEEKDVKTNVEEEKNFKDESNRNKQSQNQNFSEGPSSSENSTSISAPNKSTYGKWKRRKGLAPSRPIPQRRTTKALPMTEIRRELDVIEIQQQGLERQGVKLEQIIREKCEGNQDSNCEDAVPIEVEDLILQLFELVNEKNELFRKQAELMYLRRQQRLEEEHADIEYQIRCLMLQPEANKTDSDKAREEELINRLVEIVERRNEIIECLEMDRVRETEEDNSINNQMNLYTAKRDAGELPTQEESKEEKKKHKKDKKFKLIHTLKHKEKKHKVDVDKDVDETETNTSTLEKKKKKKFNLF